MEGKLFRVYKIILPSGNQYIGYTSLPLSERLRHHLKRAKSGAAANHPFYQELTNLTKEQCKIIELVSPVNDELLVMSRTNFYVCPFCRFAKKENCPFYILCWKV